MGVMIQMLGGNADSVAAWKASEGKTIVSIHVDDDANGGDGAVVLRFDDDTGLEIADRGRSCCESRYIVSDDDPAHHVGAKLLDAEIRDGGTTEGEYEDEHEIAFLDIKTSAGVFQARTHNEHNGWYGGFWITCRALATPTTDHTPDPEADDD